MAKTKTTKKNKSKTKERLTAHIILDRSGSMSSNWAATLEGVNAYVKALADEGLDGTVSLTMFDTNGSGACIEALRTDIDISDWTSVTALEVSPRGSTPLRDAIGTVLSRMKGKTYTGKVAVAVMTDGYENASVEYSAEAIKTLIAECEDKGWLINYLGAKHDAWEQARGLGFQATMTANYADQSVTAMLSSVATSHSHYTNTAHSGSLRSAGAGATFGFTPEQRKKMVGA